MFWNVAIIVHENGELRLDVSYDGPTYHLLRFNEANPIFLSPNISVNRKLKAKPNEAVGQCWAVEIAIGEAGARAEAWLEGSNFKAALMDPKDAGHTNLLRQLPNEILSMIEKMVRDTACLRVSGKWKT